MEASRAAGTEQVSATLPRSALRLWLYGLGMVIPAAYFAWRYPLAGKADELLDLGKLADYGVTELVLFLVGGVAMFALYALAVLEARTLPVGRALPVVFGCSALLLLLFAWMYPVNAIDIFIYAVRSRLWTEYGENPNAAYPATYWDSDPYMHFGMREWADDTSPYGPLWNLIAAPATLIGGDRIWLALVVFKALAVLCVLAGGVVIAKTVAATRPAGAATGALIYLWNPLVLWEGVANAHNDVLLALFLLLALLAWARRWNRFVIPLLVAAALIKYVGVLLVPLAVVALWRRAKTWRERWRLGLEIGVLSLLVCLVGFAPFYDLQAVVDSVQRQGELISTSPAGAILGVWSDMIGPPGPTDAVKLLGFGIVFATLGWLLVEVWVSPTKLPRASFELLFVLLLVATWNFRGWYLIWPVALVALRPLGWPFWRTLAWTFGGLLVYGHYIWIWDWWDPGYNTIRNVGVLFTFGPVILLTLAEFGRAVLPRPSAVGASAARRPGSAATADG